MAKTISVRQKKKRRGRPATGHDPMIAIRLPPEMIKAIDVWRKQQKIESFSEAVRRLIGESLNTRE